MDRPTMSRSNAYVRFTCGGTLLSLSLLTGCAGGNPQWGTLAINAPETAAASKSSAEAAPARTAKASIAELAKAQAQAPGDPKTALQYARALKAAGKAKEALAVLDAMPDGTPLHQPLLVDHGLLALELGKTTKARQLLLRATAEKTRDWRVYSGLGVASASLGMHAEAQTHFTKALELSPNNAIVLNNQAMSYILDRKLAEAEGLLKRAAQVGTPQTRTAKNLALAKALTMDSAANGNKPNDEAEGKARLASNQPTTN